ncbi:MAG: RNA polymerase sigma factor [Gemmataceae bacterium]
MNDSSVYLLSRWQQGDEAAAKELFERYAERLIALAHSRLSARLAARVGPEDVVQSVYCSFFAGARAGRYVLEQSGDLWRLLVTITVNKVQHQWKRHTSAKRSVNVESPQAGPEDGSLPLSPEMLAREPSPDESAALAELLEQLMTGLDPVHRQIFELRLQGHQCNEIAERTGRSRPTVRRVLDNIKQQLEQGAPGPS